MPELIRNIKKSNDESVNKIALAVYVGEGINQSKWRDEIIKYPKIKIKFLKFSTTKPIKYHDRRVAPKIISEYQLIEFVNLYKLDTINPKSIFGVADPLIINSGFPVYEPDNQLWIITSSFTP